MIEYLLLLPVSSHDHDQSLHLKHQLCLTWSHRVEMASEKIRCENLHTLQQKTDILKKMLETQVQRKENLEKALDDLKDLRIIMEDSHFSFMWEEKDSEALRR